MTVEDRIRMTVGFPLGFLAGLFAVALSDLFVVDGVMAGGIGLFAVCLAMLMDGVIDTLGRVAAPGEEAETRPRSALPRYLCLGGVAAAMAVTLVWPPAAILGWIDGLAR